MFQNQHNKSKADVKDGALVLYLPTAIKPCVWRIDLDVLSETSIEIDEKDDVAILATRDINGITKSIARFSNKEDAQNALKLALNALMNHQGSGGTSSTILPSFNFLKLLKWGVIIIVGLWLLSIVFSAFTAPLEEQPSSSSVTPSNTTSNNSVLDENGQIKLGVPVDVDSLFEQPE